MDIPKKTQSRTIKSASQWRLLITRFASSSMSLKAFFEVEKVSTSAFYRWRDLLGGVAVKTGTKCRMPHQHRRALSMPGRLPRRRQ